MLRGPVPSLIPLTANRVWRTYQGGKSLDLLQGSTEPCDSHFPEDWIASTTRATNKGREDHVEEGLSRVCIDGKSVLLRDLFEQYPQALLGEAHYRSYDAQSGFLVKFLDSAIRLPLQCHPTIPFAQKYLNANAGKTEAYVILHTREDVAEPYIYMGFQRPPDPQQFREAIVRQDLNEMLSWFDRIRVQPGDVFLVPGGMPHAIGEGILMIEIMEPTDFAVRIEFTCGKYVLPEQSRFMGRDVDFAALMFDFTATPEMEIRRRLFSSQDVVAEYANGRERSLIDERQTRCFSVRRLEIEGEVVRPADGPCIAIVSKGSGSFGADQMEDRGVRFGDRFFVPAQTKELRFNSKATMEVVLAYPPKPI